MLKDYRLSLHLGQGILDMETGVLPIGPFLLKEFQDFPGDPVVKNAPLQAKNMSPISGPGR